MSTEVCLGCTPVILEREATAVLGVSRRGLRRLIDDRTLQRTRRGIVVGACTAARALTEPRLAHEIRLRSLLLSFDDCYASHESSALLLGLTLLNLPAHAIGTRARGAWRGGPTLRVRIAPLPDDHVTVARGLGCTTMARTVIDIARSATMRESVVVGDAALRAGCTDPELQAMVDTCAGWADVGKARKAIAFFDGRAESALESVSRVIIDEAELPPPRLQAKIVASGSSYRLDFYWEAQRVVGEADGMSKYDDPTALRAEKVRQERLERLGLKVVRWNWREIMVDTAETMARLRAALTR